MKKTVPRVNHVYVSPATSATGMRSGGRRWRVWRGNVRCLRGLRVSSLTLPIFSKVTPSGTETAATVATCLRASLTTSFCTTRAPVNEDFMPGDERLGAVVA